jgi:DedD protein
MALLPLFKRRAAQAPEPKPAGVAEADELQSRTRARRRLIGAAVLLVIGVITFPLLFETQPRPVPVDIPMVIPAREGAPALSPPAARTSRLASGKIGDPASSAVGPAEPATPASATPAASATAVAAATPEPAQTRAPAQPPSAAAPHALEPKTAPAKAAAEPTKPGAKSAPEAKAVTPKPAAEPKPAGAKPAAESKADTRATAESKGRFVVQVGAYADEASARAARQRVERLGLKTYTQEVEVQGARRIRVRIGPFDSQQEATKALETLKAGKLPGAVLTL